LKVFEQLPFETIDEKLPSNIFVYGECRKNFNDTVHFLVEYYPKVGFTKCKVKRVVNLFEDTESVRELNYLAKISQSCFSPSWKN
jgi:hypothetical protein